jgi:hypothetical protein
MYAGCIEKDINGECVKECYKEQEHSRNVEWKLDQEANINKTSSNIPNRSSSENKYLDQINKYCLY